MQPTTVPSLVVSLAVQQATTSAAVLEDHDPEALVGPIEGDPVEGDPGPVLPSEGHGAAEVGAATGADAKVAGVGASAEGGPSSGQAKCVAAADGADAPAASVGVGVHDAHAAAVLASTCGGYSGDNSDVVDGGDDVDATSPCPPVTPGRCSSQVFWPCVTPKPFLLPPHHSQGASCIPSKPSTTVREIMSLDILSVLRETEELSRCAAQKLVELTEDLLTSASFAQQLLAEADEQASLLAKAAECVCALGDLQDTIAAECAREDYCPPRVTVLKTLVDRVKTLQHFMTAIGVPFSKQVRVTVGCCVYV